MFLDVTYDQLIAVYKNKYIMINCFKWRYTVQLWCNHRVKRADIDNQLGLEFAVNFYAKI